MMKGILCIPFLLSQINIIMAYSDDLIALGLNHLYILDGDFLDAAGTSDGTAAGTSNFVNSSRKVSQDTIEYYQSTTTTSRITLPSVSTINNAAQSRLAFGGWFTVDSIQTPPKRIAGMGTNATTIQIVMGFANNVMAEINEGSNNVQIYGPQLVPNRIYHLMVTFSGTGFDDEFNFYVDAVKQTDARPTDYAFGQVTISSRSAFEFSDPVGTVGVGGDVVLLNGGVNFGYSNWLFADGTNAEFTDTEILETIFEKGVTPDVTITTDTDANMQIALDALADTVRDNDCLCIRIEDVTGSGDLNLQADNITFDALASTHIQWMGAGTLTWQNLNGSDASIESTPNGGTVVFESDNQITLTGLIAGTEVRIYDQFGAAAVEIGGTENSGTSFSVSTTESSVDIALLNLNYRVIQLTGVDMTQGDVSISVSQEDNKVYLNP